MISFFQNSLKRANFLKENITFPKMSEKLVSIQSDDWGAQRMPSMDIFNSLSEISGINTNGCVFGKFDSLESVTDVEALLKILRLFKKETGHQVKLTLNYNAYNPDTKRIWESNFKEYYEYSSFEGYDIYGKGEVVSSIRTGIAEDYFEIGYHGRQHLNVTEYLKLLNSNIFLREAAKINVALLGFGNIPSLESPYLATYHPMFESDEFEKTKEGKSLLEKKFKVKINTFIAPVYSWTNLLESKLINELGITNIQGLGLKSVDLNEIKSKRIKSSDTRRNISFEPVTISNYDWVKNTMLRIEMCFLIGIPAVISMHRVNFTSGVTVSNRENGLMALSLLLKSINEKWKDIKFVNTNELFQNNQ